MLSPRTALPLALLVLACTPKPDDNDSDTAAASSTGEGSSASDTSATDTSPTTGDGGSASLSGETGVTATATSGETDPTGTATSAEATSDPTADSTTDPTGGPDLPAACEAMCTRMDDCFSEPEQPHDVCVSDCLGTFAGPECPAAAAAFWQCVAELTCDELLKFIDEGPTDQCVAEFGAVEEVCSECITFGSGDGGGNCSVGRECETTEEFVCAGDTCTCTVDGVPGKSCPAEGICTFDLDMMAQAAQDCCGWDWP